ncbi:MAG: hypothetical protein U1F10_04695 [Burkholderiales bacterium]
MARPRKSSTCVTLVLIGAAALTGCGDTGTNRRAQYASREACLADWGDPAECEEQSASSGGSSSSRSHIYWGPGTSSPSRSGRSSSSSSHSSSSSSSSGHSISRGGFGSHGSSSS